MKKVFKLFLVFGMFFSVLLFPQTSLAANPVAGWFTLGAESVGTDTSCGSSSQVNDFQIVGYSDTNPANADAFRVSTQAISSGAVVQDWVTVYNESLIPSICADYSQHVARVEVAKSLRSNNHFNFYGSYGLDEGQTNYWGNRVIANVHLKRPYNGSYDAGLVSPSAETVGMDPEYKVMLGNFPNIYGATGIHEIHLFTVDPDGIISRHIFYPTGGTGTYTLPPVGLTKEGDYLWAAYISLNGNTPIVLDNPVSPLLGPVAFTLKTSCTAPWGTSYPSDRENPISGFESSSVSCGSSCLEEKRYCVNGQWNEVDTVTGHATSNPLEFDSKSQFPTCYVEVCDTDCLLPWPGEAGGIITTAPQGSTVLSYPSDVGKCDNTCEDISESRFCSEGEWYTSDPHLGGTRSDFTLGYVGSCTDETDCTKPCTPPAGFSPDTVFNHLDTLTAWKARIGTCSEPCESENRACVNGVSSGSFEFNSCTPATGCTSTVQPGRVIEVNP